MPVLARRYGVTHFGFERLPVDFNPLFGGYFESTLDSPLPKPIVQIFDELTANQQKTAQQCREAVTTYLQELRVHCQSMGGGVHIRGWAIGSLFHCMLSTGAFHPGPNMFSDIFRDMNANAIELVDEALAGGGMIALYSGWGHPSVRWRGDVSYVSSIQKRLGSLEGYRDVRIVAPEYILLRDDPFNVDNETIRLSQEAPLEGVLLVQRGPQSFTLVFPRTPLL